jgi:hypothetical protein
MKAKITESNGGVIEVEGTNEEIQALLQARKGAPYQITYVPPLFPYTPFVHPVNYPHGACSCPICCPYKSYWSPEPTTLKPLDSFTQLTSTNSTTSLINFTSSDTAIPIS